MTRVNDQVVLVTDPLRHGIGQVVGLLTGGRRWVAWADASVSEHDASELELFDTWKLVEHPALPGPVLDRLLTGV